MLFVSASTNAVCHRQSLRSCQHARSQTQAQRLQTSGDTTYAAVTQLSAPFVQCMLHCLQGECSVTVFIKTALGTKKVVLVQRHRCSQPAVIRCQLQCPYIKNVFTTRVLTWRNHCTSIPPHMFEPAAPAHDALTCRCSCLQEASSSMSWQVLIWSMGFLCTRCMCQ